MAVDTGGNMYVTGVTASSEFPTASPLQGTNAGGTDVYVAELNSTGSSLIFSTYLGGAGNDSAGFGAIALDSAGNIFVVGSTASSGFPLMNATQGVLNGELDACVTKLTPSGSALLFSTFLGGAGSDVGRCIAVDSAGNVYVTGYTPSVDFPVASAAQSVYAGGADDAFVTKLFPKSSQTITFTGAPPSAAYNATFAVAASASSGLAVTLGASGACSIAGTTVTMTSGTGTCSLTADQPGDSNYSAAPQATQATTANKATQVAVTVSAPTDATFGTPGGTATAAGGNGTGAYSFSAAGSTACSVNSGTGAITVTSGTGTCSITATRAGDANYSASAPSVAATVTIHKATQTINFGALANAKLSQSPVIVSATASSS